MEDGPCASHVETAHELQADIWSMLTKTTASTLSDLEGGESSLIKRLIKQDEGLQHQPACKEVSLSAPLLSSFPTPENSLHCIRLD